MKVSDLIERLEDLRDTVGDLKVMVAHQPNYPLAASPSNITACRFNDRPTIFIACGESYDYAPRAAWDEYSEQDPDEVPRGDL